MRIRYKKWARPELEASQFYEDNPEQWKGKWKEHFERKQNPIHLELGCGKGQFIEATYKEAEKETNNVFITRFDIERINLILDKKDEIERIYINFCNPWPKGKHRKKRLTHTRQLEKYKEFLKPEAEIYFKTDDDSLFKASLNYFEENGFEVISKTYDLHNELIFEKNIETEHEKMFTEQGIKIKACIARYYT